MVAALVPLQILLTFAGEGSPETPATAPVIMVLFYGASIGSIIWGWSGYRTVGMRVASTSIIDIDTGEPIGPARALLRFLLLWALGLPLGLGFLTILLESRSGFHRGWHDLATRSKVVRTVQTSPQPPGPGIDPL